MSYWYYVFKLKTEDGFEGVFDSVASSINETFPIIAIKDFFINNLEERINEVQVINCVEISDNDYIDYCKRYIGND